MKKQHSGVNFLVAEEAGSSLNASVNEGNVRSVSIKYKARDR